LFRLKYFRIHNIGPCMKLTARPEFLHASYRFRCSTSDRMFLAFNSAKKRSHRHYIMLCSTYIIKKIPHFYSFIFYSLHKLVILNGTYINMYHVHGHATLFRPYVHLNLFIYLSRLNINNLKFFDPQVTAQKGANCGTYI
jgi:hypothetical protein